MAEHVEKKGMGVGKDLDILSTGIAAMRELNIGKVLKGQLRTLCTRVM